jgi:hypothetical protein
VIDKKVTYGVLGLDKFYRGCTPMMGVLVATKKSRQPIAEVEKLDYLAKRGKRSK